MREGWSVQTGTVEELGKLRADQWATMSDDERVAALMQLLDTWKGPDARRLARTYRTVTVHDVEFLVVGAPA
ncbi:MAG: hypothetical protein ACO1SV_22015 [Fimbriimonas sp.]